ncbi:putative nitronate monooxygenase [Drosera capensis]
MGCKGIMGLKYGIVQAPLGPDISGPELVSAVADAGGLGLLRAPDWECPEYIRGLIKKTRSLTDKPFGIRVVLGFSHEENVKVILDEKVAFLELYWGEVPEELVHGAHDAGVKVIPQVGNVQEARKAIEVGVDAIIVQGREAGGHVIGQDALIALVPRVVDLVGDRDIPVIAAGGIVDARGYVAALALGAQGVCLGTRFLATEESNAHPDYKKQLIEGENTEYTDLFGRARWPEAPQRVLEKEIRRLAGTVPNKMAEGDIESMVMYAGQGIGLIKEILPAAEVVKRLVEGAQLLIKQKFSRA